MSRDQFPKRHEQSDFDPDSSNVDPDLSEVNPEFKAGSDSEFGGLLAAGPREQAEAPTRPVVVFDTTLRDGEQTAGVFFSAAQKVEIALGLEAMGVDVIEAGFPVSSAGEAQAVAGVAGEVTGARVCALARAVPRDIAVAGEALRGAVASRIHVFVNASDMQLAHQLRKTRAQVVEMAAAMVRSARDFTDDVEFSPMDATRADPVFIDEIARATLRAGATTLNLPDTVGGAMPDQVQAMVRRVAAVIEEEGANAVVSFHGQDDLGLATANALAAIEAGAGQVELAINGIGERAGNTSFEEVVAALSIHGKRLGVHTGVDLRKLGTMSACVERLSGIPVSPNKAVVGRNAFRHASGIHQDGVLKERCTFEVLDPQAVGHLTGTEIVLGKLSGRTGFADRVGGLGYTLSDADLERAFCNFQEVAGSKGEIVDQDLHEICARIGRARTIAPGYSRDL